MFLKIQNNQNFADVQNKYEVNPSFKSIGSMALSGSGVAMQSIENGGFLTSFLIQDFLGMTMPRTIAGFLRDKEYTGEYNKQEGFEVLGREGLTGPCMMAVAPISLAITARYAGKSTNVNSELIKRYGNSLKDFVQQPNFDEKLLKSPETFKKEFYKINVTKILEDTLGKENVKTEHVDFILKQLENRENIPSDAKLSRFRGKAKFRNSCINNITEYINDIKYKTGTDLELLNKVKVSSKNNVAKTFSTSSAFEGLIKYTDDAIIANKNLMKLDALKAESIKNKALAKRMLTTVAMIAATLSVLSILPKIYARSNTAPGAIKENSTEIPQDKSNTTFKGKVHKGLLEKIGEKINKIKSDFVFSELEYNGYNFTNTLMAGLSVFGLIIPRGLRAYNRAQVDQNGKKDKTEIWEIILRDLTSALAVVFVVPMATRACVTSYEKYSGFVLMQKDRSMSKSKTILDLFNPYSKAHVMSNAELSALYDKVNSKEKMLNFCKYINNNNGDLQKILSKSSNKEVLFNQTTLTLESLKGKSKQEKNNKIISYIEGLNKKDADKAIEKVMQTVHAPKKYKSIAMHAKGLNSMPAILATLFISPYILGWFIPRLTYKNTRRIHEKKERENALQEQQKLKTNA